jgi:hypothetical protein
VAASKASNKADKTGKEFWYNTPEASVVAEMAEPLFCCCNETCPDLYESGIEDDITEGGEPGEDMFCLHCKFVVRPTIVMKTPERSTDPSESDKEQ